MHASALTFVRIEGRAVAAAEAGKLELVEEGQAVVVEVVVLVAGEPVQQQTQGLRCRQDS